MLTDKNLRCQNREFGRPALGNEYDIEQSIREVGFRRNRDSSSHVSAIGDYHIVKIKLESFGVIQRDLRRVTAKLRKRRRGSAQIGQRSPRSLHFRRKFFVHHAAKSARGNIREVANAITRHTYEVDCAGFTSRDLLDRGGEVICDSKSPGEIVPSPERQDPQSCIASSPSDPIHHLVQGPITARRHDYLEV